MPSLSPKQIEEVNELIEQVEKSIKPKCEIGAQSKVILTGLLSANKVKKKAKYIPCKREYSDTVVNYFVNEKGVAKSKFHANGRDFIFILS
jgi:hypothetical protein